MLQVGARVRVLRIASQCFAERAQRARDVAGEHQARAQIVPGFGRAPIALERSTELLRHELQIAGRRRAGFFGVQIRRARVRACLQTDVGQLEVESLERVQARPELQEAEAAQRMPGRGVLGIRRVVQPPGDAGSNRALDVLELARLLVVGVEAEALVVRHAEVVDQQVAAWEALGAEAHLLAQRPSEAVVVRVEPGEQRPVEELGVMARDAPHQRLRGLRVDGDAGTSLGVNLGYGVRAGSGSHARHSSAGKRRAT
jgi:hypothetical protein